MREFFVNNADTRREIRKLLNIAKNRPLVSLIQEENPLKLLVVKKVTQYLVVPADNFSKWRCKKHHYTRLLNLNV